MNLLSSDAIVSVYLFVPSSPECTCTCVHAHTRTHTHTVTVQYSW